MFLYPVITRGYLCVLSVIIIFFFTFWGHDLLVGGCTFNNDNIALWSVTYYMQTFPAK